MGSLLSLMTIMLMLQIIFLSIKQVLSNPATFENTLADSTQCPTPHSVFHDSSSMTVYVACYGGGVISVRGSNVTTVANSTQCPGPYSVVYDSSSATVYAACSGGDVISVRGNSDTVTTAVSSSECFNTASVFYDSSSATVFAACYTITGGVISAHGTDVTTVASSTQCQSPYSVFYDSASATVFAACSGGVISVRGYTVTTVANSTQCPSPYSVFYDSSSTTVYAACYGGSVISVRGSNVTTVADSTQCPGPYSVIYDSSSTTVYAACYNGFNLRGSVISIRGSTVDAVVGSKQCLFAISVFYDSASATVYAACAAGGVISVRGSNVTTIASSFLCPSPSSVFYDSSSAAVYATCYGGRSVISVHGNTVTTVASFAQCPSANSVVYDSSSATVYVACATGVVAFSKNCFWGSTFTFDSGCSPCGLGLASSPAVQGVCVPCNAGRYSNSLGSLNCLTCAAGTYSSALSHSCSYCDSGRVGFAGATNSSCDGPCPAGYYCQSGNPTPQPCESSSLYCPLGSKSPLLSPPGNYTTGGFENGTAQSSTLLCPAGYYCIGGFKQPCIPGTFMNAPGASQCDQCAAGSYATGSVSLNAAGSTTCQDCAPGSYSMSSSSTCLKCAPGYFTNVTASSRCVQCAAGSYYDLVGASACLSCATAFSPGAASCTHCQPGSYVTVNGTSCQTCAAGFFSSAQNALQCDVCPAGTYSNSSGFAFCVPCAFGFYSQFNQSTFCAQCTEGFVSLLPSSSSGCRACNPGSYSKTAAFDCIPCTPGTYSLLQASTGCLSCSDAGAGLICQNSTVTVMAGYWGYVTAGGKLGTAPCLHQLCGQGLIGQQCANGRQNSSNNTLCGSCLPGWSDWNGSCLDCTGGPNGALLLVFILLSWVIVFVLYFISQDQGNASFGIFVYFVQTALLMTGSVDGWLQWLSFLNFQPQSSASSSMCPLYLTPYEHIAFGVVVSVFFGVILAINAAGHYALSQVQKHSSVNACALCRLPAFSIDSYIRTAVSIFLYSYSALTSAVFQYLNCVDSGVGTRVVFSSPSIDCAASEYKSLLYFVLLALIFDVVGTPCILSTFLYLKRQYITSDSSSTASRFRFRWGVMFEPYRRELYWWQVIVLLRRVVSVLLDTFIITDLEWKMMSLTALHVALMLVNIFVQPYSLNKANHLETCFFVILVLIGLFLIAQPVSYPRWMQAVLTFLIVVPVCVFVVWYLLMKVEHRRQQALKSKSASTQSGTQATANNVPPINTDTSPTANRVPPLNTTRAHATAHDLDCPDDPILESGARIAEGATEMVSPNPMSQHFRFEEE